MVRVRVGQVLEVHRERRGLSSLRVLVDGEEAAAINYDRITGPVRVGDRVVLNTTAAYLGLGTGGVHFVMAVVEGRMEYEGPGHIMKCRYTPSQVAVLAVEEPHSPYHKVFEQTELDGTPVIVATLHSMVPAAAAAVRFKLPKARIVYVMSDGGALPAQISRLVPQMKEVQLIDAVITYGHAFGGDLEAVTVYSALLAARNVLFADVIIVAMGPGVVGTGTTWGTTALEQGTILDAAAILQGRPIAAARLSFADPRPRHRGVSHHTLTALSRVANRRATVAIPSLQGLDRELVTSQLREWDIFQKHDVREYESGFILDLLTETGLHLQTMGRSMYEDSGPFLSAAAAGLCAVEGIR